MITALTNLWWRLVFWWKKRTGWIDMGQQVYVEGTVVEKIPPDSDGDRVFNLRVDPAYVRFITLGDRMTSESPLTPATLHCEIPPWSPAALKRAYDGMNPGDRVRVVGMWGFDGVHYRDWPLLLQIPLALVRHQPDMESGWFEIHPVQTMEVLR